MQASHRWLMELSGVDVPPAEVAERLTSAGLEVEGLESMGEGLEDVVVAEVRSIRPHPTADKLRLVTLFDGESEQEVVCGAPNVPPAPGRIAFARFGATLPGGFKLEEKAIRGVVSRGMICSERELEIGEGAEGIIILDPSIEAAPGTKIADALGLRDTIYAIGLTPNRPDCLGHIGLARELALLYGRPFALPTTAPVAEVAADGYEDVSVVIDDADRCARYGAALVVGAKVGPSPFWLRYRLHCLGLRSISNVVDATNLIMLETGHPIHGFDLARLRGRSVVVRTAREGERMETLDGVERTFLSEDLLICDGEGPVAVAGVMGGQTSGVTDATDAILIECAFFDPRSVRRTSRRLGMHTDASHRFERGVDPSAVPWVRDRAASLIASLSGGARVKDPIDRVARQITPPTIELRPARVRALLGVDVPDPHRTRILEGIGARIASADADALSVEAPSHRPDITREADLIEELARIYGYDAIPTTMPRVRPSREGTPLRVRFLDVLRQSAAATGLHEAICYGFVSPRDLEAARAPTDAVRLENPLSEERSVMRTSLLPGLADAASRARRHGAPRATLFEVGSTFHPSGERLPEERRTFALLLTGTSRGQLGEERIYDFFDGKGRIEAIVRAVTGQVPDFAIDDSLEQRAPALHPRRRALVRVGNTFVGVLGELHPDVAEALELGKRAVYAALDVASLLAVAAETGDPKAPDLPRFPATIRDIALLLDDARTMAEVRDVLLNAAAPLGERVELFDLYRGEHIPEGKKSLAFRIVYRDPEGTLTDKKVDKAHERVAAAARAQLEATLR